MTPTDVFVLEDWTGSLGDLIWKYVLESLKKDDTLGEELIDWLTNSVAAALQNDILMLTTNSLLLREALKRRLLTRIQSAVSRVDPKIVVVIADDLK